MFDGVPSDESKQKLNDAFENLVDATGKVIPHVARYIATGELVVNDETTEAADNFVAADNEVGNALREVAQSATTSLGGFSGARARKNFDNIKWGKEEEN